MRLTPHSASLRAIPRPIPLELPVTSAVLPVIVIISCTLPYRRMDVQAILLGRARARTPSCDRYVHRTPPCWVPCFGWLHEPAHTTAVTAGCLFWVINRQAQPEHF